MQYIIRLNDPCNENWQAMEPEGNGRHCMSCCKTVVDFTSWEPSDILHYIQEKGVGNVCGRFKTTQLNIPIETPEILARKVLHAPIPLYRKVAAIIVLMFGVTIVSCNNDTVKEKSTPTTDTGIMQHLPDTTNAVAPPPMDTLQEKIYNIPEPKAGVDFGYPSNGSELGGVPAIERIEQPVYSKKDTADSLSKPLQTVDATMHFDPDLSSVDTTQ